MFVLGFCRMQTSLRINRKSDEKWGMWSSWIFSASGYTMHTDVWHTQSSHWHFPWLLERLFIGGSRIEQGRGNEFIDMLGRVSANPIIPVSATQNVNSNQPQKRQWIWEILNPSFLPKKKIQRTHPKATCNKIAPCCAFKEHCKQMATACAPASLRNPRGWARSTGSSCCASPGCDFIRCAGRTQLPRRNPMTRCPFRWFVAHERVYLPTWKP